MFSLVELFAADADFTARREGWPEGKKIFGLPRRVIKNKDIESTLILDERVRHYARGKDITIAACVKLLDGDVLRDYPWSNEDALAGDWILCNETEQIKHKREKLN